ncbi:alpha/beta hydrolase [Nonomuraea sp. NPDC050540]|uniref:alpha/beta hydrolase n=1 Tax=Nonomuraea sp. NPDC050540 TaxID=3364367 RepID=UPI0037986A62
MTRFVRVLTVLLMLTVLIPRGNAAAAVTSAGRAIAWAPCVENPTAECGTLTVPIDGANPGGPTIDLAVARRKATDPQARIGSLIINPGGPGESGVDFALRRRSYFSEEITRRFDIVGFDPRGVARSNPVVCSAELMRQAPADPFLKSQIDFDRWLDYNNRLRADCRARTGPLFDHVDTLSVVNDVDALRAAVGDGKLTYYGLSYGTLIGQLYAERFPGRVRALALDSNIDHSLRTAAFLNTGAATAQDSFEEFAAWCERDSACVLHDRDLRAFWANLLARAERGELHHPGHPTVTLSTLDLIRLPFQTTYGPYWRELAETMVAIDSGATPSKALPEIFTRQLTQRRAPRADGLVANPLRIVCQDFHLPIRNYREFAALLRRSQRIAPDMRVSPLTFSFTMGCLGEPVPIPNPQHRLRIDGTPTLLLGNARHDPATGHAWAASAAGQIGGEARLLTYEGWGHSIYNRSQCTRGTIDRYLIDQTLPPPGTRCPAVPYTSTPTPTQIRPTPAPLPLDPPDPS